MTQHQRMLFADGEPALTGVEPERLQLDDTSWVDVSRGWMRGADTLLDVLRDQVPWTQGRRFMYDHMVDDPRLSHGYAAGAALPHPALDEARVALQRVYRVPLGSVGLNYYRSGRDSVAPHRDREMKYLEHTVVAILTLGARRPFLVRPFGRHGESIDIAPASGDLLVLGGRCQADWLHAVPKVSHCGPRISATWRWASRQGERDRSASWRSPRRYDRTSSSRGSSGRAGSGQASGQASSRSSYISSPK